MSDDKDRIDALETRIAFQEQTIEVLNSAVTHQWALIEQLRHKVEQLEQQVLSGSFIADPATEKPPPHY